MGVTLEAIKDELLTAKKRTRAKANAVLVISRGTRFFTEIVQFPKLCNGLPPTHRATPEDTILNLSLKTQRGC